MCCLRHREYNLLIWCVLFKARAQACYLSSTDRPTDFPSCDSNAVGSCAAVGETSVLVLAVPWRQRPAQAQSKSAPKYCSLLFWFICHCLKIVFVATPQGYERVRRVSEDDGSTAPSYDDDDEEEGIEEVANREALPKEVGQT